MRAQGDFSGGDLEFLALHPELQRHLGEAERVASVGAADSAVAKARVFAETLLEKIALMRGAPRQEDETGHEESFHKMLVRLWAARKISWEQKELFFAVKDTGNDASHGELFSAVDASDAIAKIKQLAQSFRADLETGTAQNSGGDAVRSSSAPSVAASSQQRQQNAYTPKPPPADRPSPRSYSLTGEQSTLPGPVRTSKGGIGKFALYGIAAVIVLWLIGQISNAIHGSSAINFTSMATASGVENNHAIGVSSLFNAVPAQVTLYAEYANGRVSDDRVQMAVWNANGGRVAACNDITIRYERGNAWCNVSLPEGSYTFSLGANGKVLNTTQFRVVDGDRLQSMASAVLISDNVRNGQPSGDVRTYNAGSTVGMYLPYQNAQSDTVSVQLMKDGSAVNSCKDYVLPTTSGNYWCDWNSLAVGQYSIAMSIDGKNVGKYDFEIVEPEAVDATADSVPSPPTDAPTQVPSGPAPDADQATTRGAAQQYPVPALRYEARPYRSPPYHQFTNPPHQYRRYYGPSWYTRPRRQR